MKEIDVRGLSCPLPVVETKKALKENPEGVKILADSIVSKENISRFAGAMGYNLKTEEKDGIWEIELTK